MKKQITAAVMMLSMIAPAMANGLDNQAFEDQVFHTRADAPMQLAELSQKEMKETEGAFLPLAILGGAAIGMWTQHGFSYATTGRPASVRDVAGGLGAIPGDVGAAGKVVSFAKYGREIKIGNNMRIAPFGNRTGHPILENFPIIIVELRIIRARLCLDRELVVIALGNQNLRTDHGKTASNSSFFSI